MTSMFPNGMFTVIYVIVLQKKEKAYMSRFQRQTMPDIQMILQGCEFSPHYVTLLPHGWDLLLSVTACFVHLKINLGFKFVCNSKCIDDFRRRHKSRTVSRTDSECNFDGVLLGRYILSSTNVVQIWKCVGVRVTLLT